ncbi:MAG: hypothetical protein ACREVI_06190 [Steroidobacteraceae bacterium]
MTRNIADRNGLRAACMRLRARRRATGRRAERQRERSGSDPPR